jgi:hypothetical protein
MAKPKKDAFALKIDDADLRGLLRSFSKMDDVAKNDMKQIAASIASKNAQAVIQAASSAPNPRQAQAVVSSIEVVATSKDPSLKMIRKNVVTSTGARSGEIFVGSEFGSNKFKQFPARSARFGRGNEGYYLYKTLRQRQPQMLAEWLDGFKLVRDAWIGRV